MEACGSANHWGRELTAMGHEVKLIPAQYTRAYVKRNKRDAVDAAALIEASRSEEIRPVPIETIDQQGMQQLHRVREQYKRTRNARMNLVREMLREYGIDVPIGIQRGKTAARDALELADNEISNVIRPCIQNLLKEVDELQEHMKQVERTQATLSKGDPVVQRQLQTPGVGLLTATAMRAGVVDVQRFPTGRHFACWLGLTSRECSSGEKRRLGAMSLT